MLTAFWFRLRCVSTYSRKFPSVCRASRSYCTVPLPYRVSLLDKINKFGGKMPDAIGIPEEELRHAAQLSVCKINIDLIFVWLSPLLSASTSLSIRITSTRAST